MPQKHSVLRGADRFITRPVPLCRAARLLALFLWVARQQWAALSFNLWLIVENHVQQEGPEQRADTVWYRGRDERPRQPRAQLPAPLERRSEPGPLGDPAQSPDGGGIT
jgi:hypothetical protein